MFRSQQRMGAVPQWLAYTDDPALDAQNPKAGNLRPWEWIQGRGEAGTNNNRPLAPDHAYSAIFARWTSNPVFGSSDVSSNALKPSPVTSV